MSSVTTAMIAVDSLSVSPDGSKIAAVCVGWYNNFILGEQATLLYNSLKLYIPQTNEIKPKYAVKEGPEGVEISGRYLSPLSHQVNAGSPAFSPDGKTVAAASFERLVLANLESETVEEMVLPKGQSRSALGWIDSVAFAPDGNLAASGRRTGLICLWNTKTRQLTRLLSDSKSGVKAVAFARGGQILISGDAQGKVKLWPMR